LQLLQVLTMLSKLTRSASEHQTGTKKLQMQTECADRESNRDGKLTSIMAASLYFLTLRTILMATYNLCFLSQHSKHAPKGSCRDSSIGFQQSLHMPQQEDGSVFNL